MHFQRARIRRGDDLRAADLHLQHPRPVAVVHEAADLIRERVSDGLEAVLGVPTLRVSNALRAANVALLSKLALVHPSRCSPYLHPTSLATGRCLCPNLFYSYMKVLLRPLASCDSSGH